MSLVLIVKNVNVLSEVFGSPLTV